MAKAEWHATLGVGLKGMEQAATLHKIVPSCLLGHLVRSSLDLIRSSHQESYHTDHWRSQNFSFEHAYDEMILRTA